MMLKFHATSLLKLIYLKSPSMVLTYRCTAVKHPTPTYQGARQFLNNTKGFTWLLLCVYVGVGSIVYLFPVGRLIMYPWLAKDLLYRLGWL